MKNYAPEYVKSLHPLQDYYANIPSNSKHNAQIKRYSYWWYARVRSSENIPLMPSNKQISDYKKPNEKSVVEKESKPKAAFIEPGKPINECFEEIISTTSIT